MRIWIQYSIVSYLLDVLPQHLDLRQIDVIERRSVLVDLHDLLHKLDQVYGKELVRKVEVSLYL